MTWNYRVTKEVTAEGDWYAIREVFYGEHGSVGWTKDEIPAGGESVDEVREVLHRMLRACDEPVLELDPE